MLKQTGFYPRFAGALGTSFGIWEIAKSYLVKNLLRKFVDRFIVWYEMRIWTVLRIKI